MDEFKSTLRRDLPPHLAGWPMLRACEPWLRRELATLGTGDYEYYVVVEHEGGESQRPTVGEAHDEALSRAWVVDDVTLYASEKATDGSLRYRDSRSMYMSTKRDFGRGEMTRFTFRIKGPDEREVRGLEVVGEMFFDALIAGQVIRSVPEPPVVSAATEDDPTLASSAQLPRPGPEPASLPAPTRADPPAAAVAAQPLRRPRHKLLQQISENPLAATIIGGLIVALVLAVLAQVL